MLSGEGAASSFDSCLGTGRCAHTVQLYSLGESTTLDHLDDLGQLAQYGVTYWLPIASAANIAQGGAALAVAFKTRDAKIKGLALPSALSAFMGITEPAIFGVNLRFFKPFIAGCIGGGCGALVCALTSLAASGTGVTGIFGILLCLAQPVQYAIMFAVAALVSFAVSFVLYKDEPKASEQA